MAGTINCSCGHYNRHGYLCRHVFCVFGIHGIENIPQNYISPRWRKNVLPPHLHEKRHKYGPCIEETEILASKLTSTLEECIELIRNDPEKLSALLTKIQDLKKETEADIPPQAEPQTKDALYEDLLGVKTPAVIDIKNPIICNTKGNRKGSGRIVSEIEKGKNKTKARTNRKVPFKQRTCSNCGEQGHNKRGCQNPPLKKKMGKKQLGKEKVVEEENIEEDEESDEDEDIYEAKTLMKMRKTMKMIIQTTFEMWTNNQNKCNFIYII